MVLITERKVCNTSCICLTTQYTSYHTSSVFLQPDLEER